MPELLQTHVDKFTFSVATDRLYTAEGVWARHEGELVRVGLSDFIQQRSGDVAFTEVKPVGSRVGAGDEFATIETIKVNISLSAPVSGEIVEVNPMLASAPEAINQDPYGTGWLAILKVADWLLDKEGLLEPEAYFATMKQAAEQEVRKP
jgi:glycine cleavage system H protein